MPEAIDPADMIAIRRLHDAVVDCVASHSPAGALTLEEVLTALLNAAAGYIVTRLPNPSHQNQAAAQCAFELADMVRRKSPHALLLKDAKGRG